MDVDSVLLHSSPVNVSVDKELYLYALGGHKDKSFDWLLCNGRLIKKRVCLESLLDDNISGAIRPWGHYSPCYFLAEIIATGLVKEVDPSAPDLDLEWSMRRCCSYDKEEHTRMIRKLVEYLSRPEEPYIVEGRVDINRFLGSKTFLVQAMISKYVRRYSFFDMGDVEEFYRRLYSMVKDYPAIVRKYYSKSPMDTRYEELMKEHGVGFFGKGTLMAPYCNYHSSHDIVGLADTSECAILSLLCVAFYDGRGYTAEHLPPDARVKGFFKKHPKPFKYTEVENDWSRVLGSLSDSGIEYRAGRGEGRIVPTIENVCRVVCGLCGIKAAGKSTAEMAAAIHDIVLLRLRDSGGVCDKMDRMVSSGGALEFFSKSEEIRSIEVRSFLSAGCVDARIVCSEGKMKFEVVGCTCVAEDKIDAKNIVDYLGEAYLRSCHSKQRIDTDLGHGKYQYSTLGMYEKEVHDRYIVLCLDAVFVNTSRHPRLQEIRDLVMKHGSGVVQEVFAAAVEGKGYGMTKEVVEGVGMNLLSYLVRHSNGALSDEIAEEVIGAAASNGREDILEDVRKSASRDVMKRGFMWGFCLLVRNAFVAHFDGAQEGIADGHVLRAYRYGTLLEKYSFDGILTPEVERKAVEYCYDRFSGNDLHLGCLMYMTLDLNTRLLWECLSKFIQNGSEYWVVGKILSKIVMESLDVPCELLERMQQLCEERLGSEEDAAKYKELRYIVGMLFSIEHEGLIERR
jgi:hypothetical protein